MKRYFLLLSLLLSTALSAQQTAYRTVEEIPYTRSEDAYARDRCKLDIY